MGLENIVQGHGDIILRGEIEAAVKENLTYITNLKKLAKAAARRKTSDDVMEGAGLDETGKSRVYLGGLAESLHRRNMEFLVREAHKD